MEDFTESSNDEEDKGDTCHGQSAKTAAGVEECKRQHKPKKKGISGVNLPPLRLNQTTVEATFDSNPEYEIPPVSSRSIHAMFENSPNNSCDLNREDSMDRK